MKKKYYYLNEFWDNYYAQQEITIKEIYLTKEELKEERKKRRIYNTFEEAQIGARNLKLYRYID